MSFFGDSEIPAMLAEVGQDVTVAGTSVKALVSTTGQAVILGQVSPGHIIGVRKVVTVHSSSFSGQDLNGATVVVGGYTYVARMAISIKDGALTELYCAAVV